MALYRRSPYSAAPKGAKTKNEERHTRNENKAGSQESRGPAFKQELEEGSGARYPCEPLRSRISSKKAGCSSCIVARTPGGQGAQDNRQSQATKTKGKRQNETKTSKKGSNMREETSIPPDSIQDKVNHLFYLQGTLKPLQAI